MTGDAPQPGETPRTEGNPWTFDPDAAWWRGDGDRERAEALAEAVAQPGYPRRRSTPGGPVTPPSGAEEPVFAGEALDAHAAGVQDAAKALTSDDTLAEPPATVAGDRAEKVEQPADAATAGPEAERAEEQPEPGRGPQDVPEVMVLPEPSRSRPTVALERGAVPGQPSGTVNLSRTSAAEREVKRSRMENSPFWLSEEERAAAAPPAEAGDEPAIVPGLGEVRRRRSPRHQSRRPHAAAPGLFGLIALGLIAAFFCWVSAEPFWLAVGHGDQGVATVARCNGSGVTQRCAGSFAAADGSYRAGPLTLLGVAATSTAPGSVVAARMVSPKSRQAYAGGTGLLVQLRWVLGFALVLLCGLGIAGLTGTRHLETVRARRGALLMSVAGPVLLLVGFLFATY